MTQSCYLVSYPMENSVHYLTKQPPVPVLLSLLKIIPCHFLSLLFGEDGRMVLVDMICHRPLLIDFSFYRQPVKN